jgi:hypothetical protein
MLVLDKYVDDSGLVNYSRLKQERAELDKFVRALRDLDAATFLNWPDVEKIAFWLNAYNALTLKVIIDNMPAVSGSGRSDGKSLKSIRQIRGVWDKKKFSIMQRNLTLDQIEHEILRKEFKEPRIHFALNCASKGCPVLRREPYVGQNLERQLESQAKIFLSNRQNFYIDRAKRKVYLSSILKWYGDDFVDVYAPRTGFSEHNKKKKAVLYFVSLYLKEEDSRYLAEKNFSVRYLKYDWSLNEWNTQ